MFRETELKLTGRFISRASAERRRKNWTCAELARRAGLHPSFVTRLEAGDRTGVTLETVEALATALGITPTELLADEDELIRLTGRSPPDWRDLRGVTLGELFYVSRGPDVFKGAMQDGYPPAVVKSQRERDAHLRILRGRMTASAAKKGGIWPALAATGSIRPCLAFADLRAFTPLEPSAGIIYIAECAKLMKDRTVYQPSFKVVIEVRTMLAAVDELNHGIAPTMVALAPRERDLLAARRLAYRTCAVLNTIESASLLPRCRWGSRSFRPPVRQIAALPLPKTITEPSHVSWVRVDRVASRAASAIAGLKSDATEVTDAYAHCSEQRRHFPMRDELADAVTKAMSAEPS